MRFDALKQDGAVRTLIGRLSAGDRQASVSGLWGSSAPLLAALLAEGLQRPILYVTGHLEDADNARDDLEFFLDRAADLLPAWETLPDEGEIRDEIAAERLSLCADLQARFADRDAAPPVVVAPIQALMQPVPSLRAMAEQSLELCTGEERDLDKLAAWFVDHGYERLEMVETAGDFAIRGGIIDIFPTSTSDPVRVEFFGDEIESIRRFDVSTQRSSTPVQSVRLPSLKTTTIAGEAASYLDHLPTGAVVVIEEPGEVQEIGRTVWTRIGRPDAITSPEDVFIRVHSLTQVHLHRLTGSPGMETIPLAVESVERFAAKPAEAVDELVRLADTQRIVVVCDTEPEQQRFVELIQSTTARSPDAPGKIPANIELTVGLVHRGFRWVSADLIVVGHHEIFHRYRQRRRIRKAVASRAIDHWVELDTGDYVVHAAHGIARFVGIEARKKSGTQKTEEFLTLEFGDSARLHVPASQIDLVQKYIGTGAARPRLSKLGGTRWKAAKERVADAIDDLASELLRIHAVRATSDGIAYPADTAWQREFEGSFIYAETADQLDAMEEIKGDMGRSQPMDRLLCGDVGYGKTELAMRAAFKAVEYGKQVAVLVPTTVLCEQHLRSFRERMADYPFVVESINRFKTKGQATEILKRAGKGQVDILIGTHRLLSKDVAFADLGLVVIDEEQRFGVEHKERLKHLRQSVDVLTLSATPIPRTLHMALLGIRDISSLATPPMDRRSIVTKIAPFDADLIRDAIMREMNRDGQVYFVHNTVHDMQVAAGVLQSIVPECRIVVAHGQMNEHELEDAMLRFVRREADILCCTTIIESGIDIPNVNTIFINRADRFGLADLHQLRGRVGRYKHRAYCYLLLPQGRTLTATAAKRLKTIEEFSELGAGFRIAMRDLEIRGTGNILGAEQSGHIAAVGYDMYCRLLDASVRRMRGDAPARPEPVHLELDLVSHIPKRYIKSDRMRMEVYRRLADARTPEDVQQVQADLVDAFGTYPPELQTLLDQAEIRVLAGAWRIRSIVLERPDLIFRIEDLALANALFEGAAGTVRWPDPKTLHWRLPESYFEPGTMLAVLRRLLQRPGARAILAK